MAKMSAERSATYRDLDRVPFEFKSQAAASFWARAFPQGYYPDLTDGCSVFQKLNRGDCLYD